MPAYAITLTVIVEALDKDEAYKMQKYIIDTLDTITDVNDVYELDLKELDSD